MSDLRKAAEAVLEAWDWDWSEPRNEALRERMEALRQALAQPEQEPVAWLIQYKNKHNIVWGSTPGFQGDGVIGVEPLYTAPPKREWVGLTDEEVDALLWKLSVGAVDEDVRTIEAKLKEKNSG